MANILVGSFILVIFSIIIINLRHRVDSSDNTVLKTAAKVGKVFIWIRFIFFIVFFGGIILFAKSR